MHSRLWNGLVCVALLSMLGCGAPTSKPGVGAEVAPERTYTTRDFSFVLPSGWIETPERSVELDGDVSSGAAVAPRRSAPNTVVAVLAYTVGDSETETLAGRRDWFEWYSDTNDALFTRAPSEVALAGGPAIEGSLRWPAPAGDLIDVDFVRSVRGGVMYLIQCAAEPADRAAIRAGCGSIVKSFRASPRR